MDSRKRPMHTCAVSLLEIVTKLYTTTATNFNGRVNYPSPWIIHALKCQVLAILAFADDQILSLESLAEAIIPPSKQIFDKIDAVVTQAEDLPRNLDGAIEKLPDLVRPVPILCWVLGCAVSYIEFLLRVLSHWGVSKEKEATGVARKPDESKSKGDSDRTIVSETDESMTDSDCSQIKSDGEVIQPSLKEPEDGITEDGNSGRRWSNVVKGSYKEKVAEEEETTSSRGRRSQGKKATRGAHEESREVKGRSRKGKRKKIA